MDYDLNTIILADHSRSKYLYTLTAWLTSPTILLSDKIVIGENSQIGPFSLIHSKKIIIGNHCNIKPFCILNANIINFQNYVHIAPLAFIIGPLIKGADLFIGNHSRVFPFCWLEPGEGIVIGNHVGIGGHTLIFTHGVWPNYILGGPVSFGPVKIDDNVWLPWRVFVMPNVTIGQNSIIAANSTVTKSIPENCLAGGSPAKVLKEKFILEPSIKEKLARANIVLNEFGLFQKRVDDSFDFRKKQNSISFNDRTFSTDYSQKLIEGDLLAFVDSSLLSNEKKIELSITGVNVVDLNTNIIYINKNNGDIQNFISFVRRYGIRLSIIED